MPSLWMALSVITLIDGIESEVIILLIGHCDRSLRLMRFPLISEVLGLANLVLLLLLVVQLLEESKRSSSLMELSTSRDFKCSWYIHFGFQYSYHGSQG